MAKSSSLSKQKMDHYRNAGLQRPLEDRIQEALDKLLPDTENFRVELNDELHSKLLERELRESPSSIRVFLSCPMRWYLERYADIPAGEGFAEEYNRWGVMGTMAHRVLQIFYTEKPADRSEEYLEELIDFCLDELIQQGTTGAVEDDTIKGFQYLLEHDKWYQRTKASDYRPYKRRGEQTDFNNVVEWMEDQVYQQVMAIYDFDRRPKKINILENETWIRTTVNGIRINGKVDRVIVRPDGTLAIDDYKTGKDPDESIPVDILEEPYIAMGIYAKAYEHPEYKNVGSVRLLHLKTGSKYVIKWTPDRQAMVDAMLDQVTKMMNEVRDTGIINCSPAASSDDAPCSYCPASGVCPAYEEPHERSTENMERALKIGIYRPDTDTIEGLEEEDTDGK